jgi:hypothetical protein
MNSLLFSLFYDTQRFKIIRNLVKPIAVYIYIYPLNISLSNTFIHETIILILKEHTK